MHELNLLDETLDINQTSSYHLSIQASPDGFSFEVLDLVRNKYVALRHYLLDPEAGEKSYLDRLEGILKEDEFLGKEYKSVYLLYPGARFTLVPAPLFLKDQLKLYFQFNHRMEDLDELHFSHLRNAGSYLIYALPGELANTLVKHFKNLQFYHHGVPLIENPLSLPAGKNREAQISLHLHHAHMELAVHENKSLKFYNTFHFSHPHDILFFLMYVVEQLHIEPEKASLSVSGQLEKNAETYLLLKQYIRQVQFGKPGEGYTYSYTFQETPPQLYVQLLNLYPCA